MSSELVIDVKEASKRYTIYEKPRDRLLQMIIGNRKKLYREYWALKSVTLNVKRGETVGILGRNGSGKSTLLQLIAGTLTPTSGSVTTSGRIAALLELGAGFNPEFTGRQNAILNAQILGLSDSEIDDKIPEIQAFANVGSFFDQPVKTYSSGMYVRVAFAVQACIEPDILIVDEALAVGDEKFQRKCYEHLEQLRAKGTSILLVTHSTTIIERFCQRALLLHEGEVHGFGPSNKIVDQYHALLYADQKSYLRYLAQTDEIDNSSTAQTSKIKGDVSPPSSGDETTQYASIDACQLLDVTGEECEVFPPEALAHFRLEIVGQTENYEKIQAGLSIRTIEGVSAYGTSTAYFDRYICDLKNGERRIVDFTVRLHLSPGTYFVSFAIANPTSTTSIEYVDKVTDALLFKVEDYSPKCSGIAHMVPQISDWRG